MHILDEIVQQRNRVVTHERAMVFDESELCFKPLF